MGDKVAGFGASFNGSIRVQLSDSRTSSDGGAIALREVLDASGVISSLETTLVDRRDPARIRHTLADQLRTLIIQRGQGWIDQADTTNLRDDPLLALCCSGQRGTAALEQARPSQPTLSRLFAALADPANLGAVHEGLMQFTDWRLRSQEDGRRPELLTLDIDGVPMDVFGHQGGSAYNGHYHSRIYQPLIASIAETGDLLGGLLREGNVGPAADADTWIPTLVNRMKGRVCDRVQVRIDAGFTGNPTLNALEDHGIPYLGRLRGNPALDRVAVPYLTRPVGRPPAEPREWAHDLSYQAQSWTAERRVILVIQERPGELFPHHFWIVTNIESTEASAFKVLDLYRRRGKAEAHFGELKSVIQPHLSCTDRGASTVQQVMARNEVNLLLSLYAYQAMHALRCILAEETGQGWSLQRLRDQVLKVAATVRVHARQIRVDLGSAAKKWWYDLRRGLSRVWAVP